MNIMIVGASRAWDARWWTGCSVTGMPSSAYRASSLSTCLSAQTRGCNGSRPTWLRPPKRLSTSRIVRMLLSLSNASFVRELVMPALRDERF